MEVDRDGVNRLDKMQFEYLLSPLTDQADRKRIAFSHSGGRCSRLGGGRRAIRGRDDNNGLTSGQEREVKPGVENIEIRYGPKTTTIRPLKNKSRFVLSLVDSSSAGRGPRPGATSITRRLCTSLNRKRLKKKIIILTSTNYHYCYCYYYLLSFDLRGLRASAPTPTSDTTLTNQLHRCIIGIIIYRYIIVIYYYHGRRCYIVVIIPSGRVVRVKYGVWQIPRVLTGVPRRFSHDGQKSRIRSARHDWCPDAFFPETRLPRRLVRPK